MKKFPDNWLVIAVIIVFVCGFISLAKEAYTVHQQPTSIEP